MSLLDELHRAVRTPVDYKFIHSVVSPVIPKLGMVLHESLPDKPSLKRVMGSHDAVCILFRVLDHGRPTPIAHWTCLFKGKHNKLYFFDSLALNLKGIYRLTNESHKIEHALIGHKYQRSHQALQKLISHQKFCGAAVATRLRYAKTKTNREFERFILGYDKTHPGQTCAMLCLWHYTDQHEYEMSKKVKKSK